MRTKLSIDKGLKLKKGISEKNYALNPSLDDFNINCIKIFISSFLNGLWNYPEAIFHILDNSDEEIIKTNLAPFICQNFYCNHLSGNYLENNLLYVITMMLKKEIDGLTNINQLDTFLENTKCGFLLEELQKIPDIQLFFKKVITRTVEKIERECSFREINFKISEILREFNEMIKEEENNIKEVKNLDEYYKRLINRKLIDLSINFSKEENNIKSIRNNTFFVKNYSPDLTANDIKIRADNAKKDNNNNLFQHFNKIENEIKSKGDLFTNATLMKNIFESNSPTSIYSFYQNNFLEVISFLNTLIEDLMKNILLLPNSIKYICKIISILIKNKFKNISKTDENAFISKFIIGKLLAPIFSFPSFNAFISDFVISGNTIKNIQPINFVLEKLFSGKLFKNNEDEGDYTSFNWFFIDNMDKIFSFFDKATYVKLPNFIEQYINGKLPKDYSYEYFNENKDQICSYISICFNYDNLFYLVEGLKKSKNFFKDKNKNEKLKLLDIYLEKFGQKDRKDKTIMEQIKNINEQKTNQYIKILKKNEKDKNKEKSKEKIIEFENYYLYKNLEIEKKYENLFLINNKIPHFYIDIKKEEEKREENKKENKKKDENKLGNKNKLSENEKNIIKVKNYLCSSLGNYRILDKSDFNIGSTSNIIKMLEEIKTYMSLPTFILNNNTIPSIWYINSLLEYLNKIPKDYKDNDFKKLFNELKEDLNNSINNLNFEILILFRNKLKFIDKKNNYYDNQKQLFNDILINEKIKYIAEQFSIPVEITFNYEDEENDKDKKFDLTKSNIKEKLLENRIKYEIPKRNITVFKTIEIFTRYFPNLSKYQLIYGVNPFKVIKDLSINTKINNYFEIIKEKVTKNYLEVNLYKEMYQEKIKNYIMDKLFEKLYPQEPDDMDKQIYQKSTSLSWIEPQRIIKKDYIFDIMLPDILNEFEKIENVRTPYKKLECINNIIHYIENLVKFNEGEDKVIGADEIGPILNYVLIKAHPFRINTDIEFIRLFSENYGKHNINLANFENMYKDIIKYTAKDFGLSQEEFEKKCLEVI